MVEITCFYFPQILSGISIKVNFVEISKKQKFYGNLCGSRSSVW